MFFRQYGIEGLKEVVLFPGLQHDGRAFLAGDGAKLITGIFGRNGFLQIAFDGQVKPFLGALLNLEAHARRVAQDTQQADRLIGEAVNGKRPHFGALDIGQSVCGIEQQAARGGVQRNGDGVEGEVAAAQVFHDGGPANLGTRSRTNVMIVARGGNAAFAVAGEEQFDMAKLFILGEDFGATFFEFVSDLRGIALDGEIEIAQRSAGNEVANGSAGQIHIEPECGGEFLHAQHHGALFRREPAFQQKHIVWHCAPSASGCPR